MTVCSLFPSLYILSNRFNLYVLDLYILCCKIQCMTIQYGYPISSVYIVWSQQMTTTLVSFSSSSLFILYAFTLLSQDNTTAFFSADHYKHLGERQRIHCIYYQTWRIRDCNSRGRSTYATYIITLKRQAQIISL